MNILKKIGLALALLLALGSLAGCGGSKQVSLYDDDVAAYSHPESGASFMVPQSWEKLAEAQQSVLFANPEQSLALTVYLELGGYTYYSDDELLDIAQDICKDVLTEPEILRNGGRSDLGGQLVTAAGALAEEPDVMAVCEVLVLSPMPAVRYYLVALGSPEDYEANSRLLEEIYLSFYTNKSADELYEGLDDVGAGGLDVNIDPEEDKSEDIE